MEYLFFPVSGNDAYNDTLGFHTNYFINNNGFLWSLLVAVGIALVLSLLFYFAFARNITLAKKLNWFICSLIVGGLSYGACDLFLIGQPGSQSTITFYNANNELVKSKVADPMAPSYAQKKIEIENDLKKYKDVRVPFDFTTAAWSWIFFFGISCCIKGYSKYANHIPF